MSGAGATAPLPQAVISLLAEFGRDAGVGVRLWARRNGGWVALYPARLDGVSGPAANGARLPLCAGSAEAMELEVVGGPVADLSLAFLARAVDQILSYEREAELAARELTERYEEINLLYSISETLGSVVSLEVASGRILSEVADLLGARRAVLWVYEPRRGELRLAAAVGDDGMSGPIAVDDPASVTARVFRDRQPINLEQGVALPRGALHEPRPGEREAFLSVPIQFTPPDGASRTVGVITLIGRRTNVRFSAGDARLLAAIASQIGAALETHRLMEENVRHERFLREMELAHDLQMKLLPDISRLAGRADVAARCAPAESVAGDFFHFFPLSGNRLGVMIGDVSGHGFSAAMIMALTLSAVAIYAQEAGPPAEALRRVHEALIGELESTEMYMTLFYGVIDPDAGRLRYANAGHPHAFRIPAEGAADRLAATSPPLGVIQLPEYREAETVWRSGSDLLCLFTDGLSDALTASGGVTGEVALLDRVLEMRRETPQRILDRLFRDAVAAGHQNPADDRTAVLLRT